MKIETKFNVGEYVYLKKDLSQNDLNYHIYGISSLSAPWGNAPEAIRQYLIIEIDIEVRSTTPNIDYKLLGVESWLYEIELMGIAEFETAQKLNKANPR